MPDQATHAAAAAAEDAEETGWKYIHGDVFRFPPQLSLFCACVGTGTQILTMSACIFGLALVGVFYPYNRGALLVSCVVRASWVSSARARWPCGRLLGLCRPCTASAPCKAFACRARCRAKVLVES